MQINPYDSLKARPSAKVLCLTIFIFFGLMSCAHRPDSSTEKKTTELLQSQLDIVMNYLDQSDLQRAHIELRKLLIEYPDNPKVLNLMGLTNLGFKKPELAASFFRSAYKAQKDPAYILNLSSAYIEQDKSPQAIKLLKSHLNNGIASYPYPERFYHNLGFAYEKERQILQAKKNYEQALDINPMYYPTLIQIAKLQDSNNQAKKTHYYTLAKESCPNCFEPVAALTRIYNAEKQTAKATETLQAFLKRNDLVAADRKRAADLLGNIQQTNTMRARLSLPAPQNKEKTDAVR